MLDAIWDCMDEPPSAKRRKKSLGHGGMDELEYLKDLMDGVVEPPQNDIAPSPITILHAMARHIASMSQLTMQKQYCLTFLWTLLPKLFGKRLPIFWDELRRIMHLPDKHPRRLSVLACKRQDGKTYGISQMCLTMLLHIPKIDIMVGSSNIAAAEKIITNVSDFVAQLPEHQNKYFVVTKSEIRYIKGTDNRRLFMSAVTGDKLRGMSAQVIIIDEFAAITAITFERGYLGILVKPDRTVSVASTINSQQGKKDGTVMQAGGTFGKLLSLKKKDPATGVKEPAAYVTHWVAICPVCAANPHAVECKCYDLFPTLEGFLDLRSIFAPLVSDAARREELYGMAARQDIRIDPELVDIAFDEGNRWVGDVNKGLPDKIYIAIDPHAGSADSSCAIVAFYRTLSDCERPIFVTCGIDEFRDLYPSKTRDRACKLAIECINEFSPFAELVFIIEDSMGSANGRVDGICELLRRSPTASGVVRFVKACAGKGREDYVGVSSDPRRKEYQWKTLHGIIMEKRLRFHHKLILESEVSATVEDALDRLRTQITEFNPLTLTGKGGSLGRDDINMALQLGVSWPDEPTHDVMLCGY